MKEDISVVDGDHDEGSESEAVDYGIDLYDGVAEREKREEQRDLEYLRLKYGM